ncbi:MAG: type II toxin-antitoxin system RatA family toxin [Gammaproteobacteria bacterium]
MTTINKSVLIPYSPTEMFELVNAIEIYPEFLPWCKRTKVLSRDNEEVKAAITLSKSGVEKTFTTSNRIQPGKMIEMKLIEGPFKRLGGFWRFDPLGDEGCKVSLDMEFEFSNRILDRVIGPVFSQIANSLVDSFHKRAVEVYGKR